MSSYSIVSIGTRMHELEYVRVHCSLTVRSILRTDAPDGVDRRYRTIIRTNSRYTFTYLLVL